MKHELFLEMLEDKSYDASTKCNATQPVWHSMNYVQG